MSALTRHTLLTRGDLSLKKLSASLGDLYVLEKLTVRSLTIMILIIKSFAVLKGLPKGLKAL